MAFAGGVECVWRKEGRRGGKKREKWEKWYIEAGRSWTELEGEDKGNYS